MGWSAQKMVLFNSVRSYLHLSGHLSGSLPASHLSEEGLRLAPGVHQGRVEAFEARCREAELDHLSWHGAHAGTPTKLETRELDCLFSSLIGSSLKGIQNECFSFESLKSVTQSSNSSIKFLLTRTEINSSILSMYLCLCIKHTGSFAQNSFQFDSINSCSTSKNCYFD